MALQLKKMLIKSIRKNPSDAILLSGGLDSSVLAALDPKMKGVTINLESYGDDKRYSRSIANYLAMEHYHKIVEIDEALEAIPEVIRILGSFDPAIPNDLAVYFGLKFAKGMGIKKIATGDGSDELFAGYDYMRDISDLNSYIHRLSKKMRFNSNELGDVFGITVMQPYLDNEIMGFALDLPTEFKIKKESKNTWGKWILRKAFEDVLPRDIIWQSKRPLEYGSGMNKLRNIISGKISDEEFKENTFPIRFMNKEHLYYYKIFRDVIGEIPRPKDGEMDCPGCGGWMGQSSFHCRICGYVMDWRQN